MNRILTGTEMKLADRYTIEEIGIPSLVLMERAAYSIYEEIVDNITQRDQVLSVCGIGNNGADGIAIARILFQKGFSVSICLIGNLEKASEEFLVQYKIATALSIPVVQNVGDREYTVIIDSIFGIGLSREVQGIFRETIDEINRSGAFVVAVDVPSGICADTGIVYGTAIRAHMTVTFGVLKTGLVLYPGAEYAGEVVIKDIGIPEAAYPDSEYKVITYTKKDLTRLPKRNPYSNKGTYGKVLIIAGSENMCGAAYLSAKAAYRMGTGLVRILTVKENRVILQTLIPEAILTTYDSEKPDTEIIQESIDWAEYIVAGPGMGLQQTAKLLIEYSLQAGKPIVLDADALNFIAKHKELMKFYHDYVMITPHIGEMSRLTDRKIRDITDQLIETCKRYAEQHHIVCVLKDARTVVCDGLQSVYLNQSGNSGMATAGSGDVLTGIIAGLLAGGMNCFEAASFGVYLHGLAGDEAKLRKGEYALMASDIIEALSFQIIIGDE